MLDKLIESTNTAKQTNRSRRFLAAAGTLVSGVFTFALVASIFSANLAMASGEIVLSELIAPAVIPEAAPPAPEEQKTVQTKSAAVEKTTRVINMQRLDEAPVKAPERVSTTQNKYKARPNVPFTLSDEGDFDRAANSSGVSQNNPIGGGSAGGFGDNAITVQKTDEKPDKNEKPVTPPPVLEVKPPAIVSGGVVNGNATYLAQPVLTSAVRALNLKGSVKVNVLIDENGQVASANASDGHALLKPLAERAARSSKFNPTKLSNVPVKVRGVIVYNFK